MEKLNDVDFIEEVLVDPSFRRDRMKRIEYLAQHAESDEHRKLLTRIVEKQRKKEAECWNMMRQMGILMIPISIYTYFLTFHVCTKGSYLCFK